MTDETHVAQGAAVNAAPGAESPGAETAQPQFPTEPFPCPNCGQMLGPDVRVCVACRQAIDPSQIKLAVVASTPQIHFTPRAQAQVRFPWGIFLVFLVLGSVMTSEGATALGPLKALLVIGAMQVISSIWVFYDAHQKGIPKPFHWGIGSLFFWLPIFSWYLVRRRQPQAACPQIEAGAWQFLRTLVLIFVVTMFLTILLSLLLGAGRGPAPKSPVGRPAGHGGSIATATPGMVHSPEARACMPDGAVNHQVDPTAGRRCGLPSPA
jgi:hypothetical protein